MSKGGASGGEERSDERKVVSYVRRRYDAFAVASLQPLVPSISPQQRRQRVENPLSPHSSDKQQLAWICTAAASRSDRLTACSWPSRRTPRPAPLPGRDDSRCLILQRRDRNRSRSRRRPPYASCYRVRLRRATEEGDVRVEEGENLELVMGTIVIGGKYGDKIIIGENH